MDPERVRRVGKVFDQAAELPDEERPAFLDQACAGDEALRREVEALLAADQRSERFLRRPPRNTNKASPWRCSAMGMVSTYVSGSTDPSGNSSDPPKAKGSTKRLMASKYSGNSQAALRTWSSLTFSTTAT